MIIVFNGVEEIERLILPSLGGGFPALGKEIRLVHLNQKDEDRYLLPNKDLNVN